MAITDIPLFSMLRTRMHWHQERQRVLAENVANADTPRFQPRDLAPPRFDQPQVASALRLAQTDGAPIGGAGGRLAFSHQHIGGLQCAALGQRTTCRWMAAA